MEFSRHVCRVLQRQSILSPALENLVHLNPSVAFKSVAIELEFDDKLIETIGAKSLPPNWTEEPPAGSTMRLGDQLGERGTLRRAGASQRHHPQ